MEEIWRVIGNSHGSEGKGQQLESIKECLKLNWYFKRFGGLKTK